MDLSLRSSVLSSIKVSNCPSLQRISIVSNSLQVWFGCICFSGFLVYVILSWILVTFLQKLVLPKQESLTSLELQCRGLLEVDLTDCESLTNSICEVFSDGGGCPMLKSLILDNCEVCNLLWMPIDPFYEHLVVCYYLTVIFADLYYIMWGEWNGWLCVTPFFNRDPEK